MDTSTPSKKPRKIQGSEDLLRDMEVSDEEDEEEEEGEEEDEEEKNSDDGSTVTLGTPEVENGQPATSSKSRAPLMPPDDTNRPRRNRHPPKKY